MNAPGIFTNPFVEGLILVVLGMAAIAVGSYVKDAGAADAGKLIIGAGLGYFTHAAVTKPV